MKFITSNSAEWDPQTLRQVCSREDPESAMCVQNFNDSRGLAIRITYRISLRSSSLWEPRHPPLKVVSQLGFTYRAPEAARQPSPNILYTLGHLGQYSYHIEWGGF